MAGEYYSSIDEKQAFSRKRSVTVQTMLTTNTYLLARWRIRYVNVLSETANKFYDIPPLRAELEETRDLP
jgi:hypothetical protein